MHENQEVLQNSKSFNLAPNSSFKVRNSEVLESTKDGYILIHQKMDRIKKQIAICKKNIRTKKSKTVRNGVETFTDLNPAQVNNLKHKWAKLSIELLHLKSECHSYEQAFKNLSRKTLAANRLKLKDHKEKIELRKYQVISSLLKKTEGTEHHTSYLEIQIIAIGCPELDSKEQMRNFKSKLFRLVNKMNTGNLPINSLSKVFLVKVSKSLIPDSSLALRTA